MMLRSSLIRMPRPLRLLRSETYKKSLIKPKQLRRSSPHRTRMMRSGPPTCQDNTLPSRKYSNWLPKKPREKRKKKRKRSPMRKKKRKRRRKIMKRMMRQPMKMTTTMMFRPSLKTSKRRATRNEHQIISCSTPISYFTNDALHYLSLPISLNIISEVLNIKLSIL